MEEERTSMNILSLPTELLVTIILYLSDARDKVKLLYVSRRLRTIIYETPSLWREFMWPHYDSSEELCVSNLLKFCGKHVVQLSFPHHVTVSKLVNLIQHCHNVSRLVLPTSLLAYFNTDQLRSILQCMKNLKSLDIRPSTSFEPLLALCSNVEELTIRIRQYRWREDFLHKWIAVGCIPQNLNVVFVVPASYQCVVKFRSPDALDLCFECNSDLPLHYTAELKIYWDYKAPLNLFYAMPIFQIQYGHRASLPFVKASIFGLLNLEEDLVLLTNRTCVKETVYNAELVSSSTFKTSGKIPLNLNVTNLNFVTYFEVGSCRSLHPGHLEQLAIACPNLQRINLRNNSECLRDLQGLRMVANHCGNLKGINIQEIPAANVECCLQFWEILSSMKLTYIVVEFCVVWTSVNDPVFKKRLIDLFQKCSSLQALESGCECTCFACQSFSDEDFLALSYFPSLSYCGLIHPIGVQCVMTSCKQLRCFRYDDCCAKPIPLSLAYNNLQQLYIASEITDLTDTFMDSVSTHGGLIYVILVSNSVSTKGITDFIINSPKLIIFNIYTDQPLHDSEDRTAFTVTVFNETLKMKFSHRKLFKVDGYKLVMMDDTREDYDDIEEALENTDLIKLWT